MEKKLLNTAQRRLELEKCENDIKSSARKTTDEIAKMGAALYRIRQEELWPAKAEELDNSEDGWVNYVENYLGLDIYNAWRCIQVYQVSERLKGSGLMLPDNESQAIELSRAPEARQIPIWQSVVETSEEKDKSVTVRVIKAAVAADQREQQKAGKPISPPKGGIPKASAAKGVTVTLSDDDDGEKEQPERPPRFSETGEAAIDKIRSVCGKPVAEAIYEGRLRIPQRDLIEWAEQEEQLIHTLAHYIVELRWTLKKAMQYEAELIHDQTTVTDLLLLTRARGGKYAFSFLDGRFTIQTGGKK